MAPSGQQPKAVRRIRALEEVLVAPLLVAICCLL